MRLLLIEQNDLEARNIAQLMAAGSDEGLTMRHVHNCEGGFAALRAQPYDIVLLDLSPPDGDRADALADTVATLVREHPETAFIVLSGTPSIDDAVHAVRLGVQDYLVKGRLDVEKLQRAIRLAVERKHIERQLEFLAGYDQLTSLANRQRLHSVAEHALANAERQGAGAALLFIDLDHFKEVNDQWGHAAGDELLAAVGSRIRNAIRRGDTPARFGGDEFAVFLEGADSVAAEAVSAKILRSLDQPFAVAGAVQLISASIGVALYPEDGADLTALLHSADGAMYAAKGSGRNTWKRHDPAGSPVTPARHRPSEPHPKVRTGSLERAGHG